MFICEECSALLFALRCRGAQAHSTPSLRSVPQGRLFGGEELDLNFILSQGSRLVLTAPRAYSPQDAKNPASRGPRLRRCFIPMPASVCSETGRVTLTQSSWTVFGYRPQMDVWPGCRFGRANRLKAIRCHGSAWEDPKCNGISRDVPELPEVAAVMLREGLHGVLRIVSDLISGGYRAPSGAFRGQPTVKPWVAIKNHPSAFSGATQI